MSLQSMSQNFDAPESGKITHCGMVLVLLKGHEFQKLVRGDYNLEQTVVMHGWVDAALLKIGLNRNVINDFG